MDKGKITITINGPAGVGKTTVGVIVTKALELAGVVVERESNFEKDIYPSHLDGRTLEAIRDRVQVSIREQQTRRINT